MPWPHQWPHAGVPVDLIIHRGQGGGVVQGGSRAVQGTPMRHAPRSVLFLEPVHQSRGEARQGIALVCASLGRLCACMEWQSEVQGGFAR